MNPALLKFLADLVEGAIYGAAIALLALPDATTSGQGALLAVLGGAIGGVKAVARVALARWVADRRT